MAIKFIAPSEARLRRLVGNGYFPAELPPPFTTADFAKDAGEYAASWDGEKIGNKFWTRPESYSMPRYGHARRTLSIVNPVNQLHVSNLISKNWLGIRKRLKRSKITEFDAQIVMKGSGRAVTGVDFDGVARRRAEILGSYGRYVKTDVARFYPSIYTHSIPWALLGKDWVKANRTTKAFKSSFGNLLDKAVASGQQGQTVGIPIGPDTSRIISELIATEVEEITTGLIPDLDHRAVRYVDDVLIGLKENESPSSVLSAISIALYDFELDLNAEKTVTHGIGCAHSPEWIHYVRTFELSANAARQRDDLDSFFEQALFLADANPRENVLLFAAKRAAGFAIDPASVPHLVRWLLYAARRSPSCLSFVAEHLAVIKPSDAMSEGAIEAYILQQIPLKAEAVHTHEVAWLLFWAREIGLKVPSAVLEKVITLRSSVVAMLVLDLNQKGFVEGQLNPSLWFNAANADGLRSEMWLVAYEATRKGWWPRDVNTRFITADTYFADIWNKDVEFYDPDKKARKKVKAPFLMFGSSWGGGGSPGYPE
jgi:hypothetical protein